ncbi:MAG: hypothetical protein WAL72_15365 [Streptosporangiaceae bacterium]
MQFEQFEFVKQLIIGRDDVGRRFKLVLEYPGWPDKDREHRAVERADRIVGDFDAGRVRDSRHLLQRA